LELQTNGKIKTIDADINRMKVGLKTDDKLERRRLSRCAGDFKNILEKYSQCRTVGLAKIHFYTYIRLYSFHFIQAIGIQKKENTLPEEPEEDEPPAPELKQAEKQQLVVDTSQLEIALLENREEKVRQLEVDMLDLNSIMLDMAAMTDEQGDQISEIHNNVEAAVDDVEEGATQLAKANRFATQKRKWYLVFIIIAVIFLILVLYFLLAK
jgi:SNARE domain